MTVLNFIENRSVIAIGPGIGRNKDTTAFIKKYYLIKKYH